MAEEGGLKAALEAREVRALARAITLAERQDSSLAELLAGATRPPTLGVTGPPGAGKSTLVDALLAHLVGSGATVAVLAADPSSTRTGGSLLGDRARMQRHALDRRVFIRSMAARGHLGGLTSATRDALLLLGRFGFDQAIVETVGVGQSEVEVAKLADTTVLVLTPEAGDSLQVLKAGVMEIADIVVVNKSDLGGEALARDLAAFGLDPSGKAPTVLLTEARSGRGVEDLWAAVEAKRASRAATPPAEPPDGRRRAALDLVAEGVRMEAARLLREDPLLQSRLGSGASAEELARLLRSKL